MSAGHTRYLDHLLRTVGGALPAPVRARLGTLPGMKSLLRRWRRLRAGTIQVGVGAGLWFSPGPSNPDYASGDNELPVQEALARYLRPGDVCYDVGANVGFITVIAARLVGEAGRVFAFEPVPANAALVRDNAAWNGFSHVTVVEEAVAARSGQARLALAAYAGGSGLAHLGVPPDATGVELTVPVVAIDDLVFTRGMPAPRFVKIDVEGAEGEVLRGMARTLRVHRPIVLVETDDADAAALQNKREACRALLREAGYEVRPLPPSYESSGWHVAHDVGVPPR